MRLNHEPSASGAPKHWLESSSTTSAGFDHESRTCFHLRRKRPRRASERLRHADQAEFERWPPSWRALRRTMPNRYARRARKCPNSLATVPRITGSHCSRSHRAPGEEWVERARAAALALSAHDQSLQNLGSELLADIKGFLRIRWVEPHFDH